MTQPEQQQSGGTALVSQDPVAESTMAAMQRFGEAFNRQDLDAVLAAMTDDSVLESSFPQPDGTICKGKDAVRAQWQGLFSGPSKPVFETEEIFAVGDRCVFRWICRWVDKDGEPRRLRGMDLIRIRDGKVAEKLVYAKANPYF